MNEKSTKFIEVQSSIDAENRNIQVGNKQNDVIG
jgi:hypothetical protein